MTLPYWSHTLQYSLAVLQGPSPDIPPENLWWEMLRTELGAFCFYMCWAMKTGSCLRLTRSFRAPGLAISIQIGSGSPPAKTSHIIFHLRESFNWKCQELNLWTICMSRICFISKLQPFHVAENHLIWWYELLTGCRTLAAIYLSRHLPVKNFKVQILGIESETFWMQSRCSAPKVTAPPPCFWSVPLTLVLQSTEFQTLS